MHSVVPSDGDSCMLPRELKLYLSVQSLLINSLMTSLRKLAAVKNAKETCGIIHASRPTCFHKCVETRVTKMAASCYTVMQMSAK